MLVMLTMTRVETAAGTRLLEGLDAYNAGDLDTARQRATEARLAAGDATVGRYCDGLAYATVVRYSPANATWWVRQALVAMDDTRAADLPEHGTGHRH